MSRGQRRPGFTLIEVLLALAILAVALALIVGVSTRAMSSVTTSRQSADAAELAQRKMAELVQAGAIKDPEETPWAPLDTSDLSQHPQWMKKVSLVSPLGAQEPPPLSAQDPASQVRLLEVTVRLEDDPDSPAFRLSTLFPPPPPAAPAPPGP